LGRYPPGGARITAPESLEGLTEVLGFPNV
jgi:hypothetical protein